MIEITKDYMDELKKIIKTKLDKFKVNLAIATGPFITITNDIIGMLIYMTTTTILMR